MTRLRRDNKILLNIHEYKGWPAFCVRGVRSDARIVPILDARIVPILCLNKPPSCFFAFPEVLKEPSTETKAIDIIHQVQSKKLRIL